MRLTQLVWPLLLGSVGCAADGASAPSRELSIINAGGGGVVSRGSTTAIGDLECGAFCAVNFPPRSDVELLALPDPGQQFLGWAGSCTGTGACNLLIQRPETVTANFGPVLPVQAVDLGAPNDTYLDAMAALDTTIVVAGASTAFSGLRWLGPDLVQTAEVSLPEMSQYRDLVVLSSEEVALVGSRLPVGATQRRCAHARVMNSGTTTWSDFACGEGAVQAVSVKGQRTAMAGVFTGTLDLGPAATPGAGGRDAFVGWQDVTGGPWQALTLGSANDDVAMGVALDPGRPRVWALLSMGAPTVVAGVDVPAGISVVAVDEGVFSVVAHLGGVGTFFGDNYTLSFGRMIADVDGGVLVASSFTGQLAPPAVAATGVDVVAARIAADGTVIWREILTGVGPMHLLTASIWDDELVLAGHFEGELSPSSQSGVGTLTSQGGFDAFVLGIAVGTGDVRWTRRLGTSYGEDDRGLVATSASGLVVAATMRGLASPLDFLMPPVVPTTHEMRALVSRFERR